jgi:hypothetical protein
MSSPCHCLIAKISSQEAREVLRLKYLIIATLAFMVLGCTQPKLEELPLSEMENTGEPNLHVASDGGVTLTYLQQSQGMATLYVRRLIQDRWSEPKKIAQGADLLVNWADFPTLIERDDRLTAQWMIRNPAPGFAYDVYTASSIDDGETWSPPQRLHADTSATEHGFVSLYHGANGVGAFWLDGQRYAQDDAPEGMELRHRLIDPVGPQSEDIVDALVCDCCQTDVAVIDGSPLVVYRDRSEANIRDISLARQENGVWVTTPVAQEGWYITGCPVNGPAVAAAEGVVAVAWFTAMPVNSVWVAFSFDGGRSFQAPVEVSQENPVGRVDLVLDASGNALVSWLSTHLDGFVYRRVQQTGELDEINFVAPVASHRKAGLPRMARSDNRLLFAWTDSFGDTPVVRSMRAL